MFKATKLFGGPVRFIIAGSGHIAGVINPPAAKKYQYWTNDTVGAVPAKANGSAPKSAKGKVSKTASGAAIYAKGQPYPATVEEWWAGAASIPVRGGRIGTRGWRACRARRCDARNPGDGKLKVLGDAPGTYVNIKAQ